MRRAVATLAVLGLLGIATTTTATTAAAGEPLPERKVTAKVVETDDNRLILKGNVSPGHTGKPVIVQKRNCLKKRCHWFEFTTVTSSENGGYRAEITAPRRGSDYFRAKVEKHGDYATSYSRTWRTFAE